VDVVLVDEFGCPQELIPVVLFVAREDADKLFELLVDALGLAVSLWVVSGGGSGFNTDKNPCTSGSSTMKSTETVSQHSSGISVG
jgi:hypothetical protein